MEEKNSKKGSVSAILLIIALIVIGVMAFFLYQLNNEKNAEAENVKKMEVEIHNLENDNKNLQLRIETLEDIVGKLNDEELKIPDVEEGEEKEYIEMTEENYNKYNSNGYRFEILDMVSNDDDTVTISGVVYKLKELPTLSEDEYNELLDGKKVTVMGYEMEKIEEDTAGHDLVIGTSDETYIRFYVSENDDGTGKLYDYTEAALYELTDIYMEIIVDKDIDTESGFGNISLEEYLKGWFGTGEAAKEIEMIPGYNTEFIFEDGECTLIKFTSV